MASNRWWLVLGVCCALLSSIEASWAQDEDSRWEKTIVAFEQQDHADPPKLNGILFVGSSSIGRWDVQKTLPGYDILNRGFGGSQMSDVLQYMDRIVLRYRPRVVVLYEGDNDIAAGEPADQVVDEFRELAERFRAALPESELVYLSIKPSISRWQLYPTMKRANDAIADYCQHHERCHFIDVSQVMFDDQGRPMKELFVDDGLHMNDAGYRRWANLVRPRLAP